MADKKLAIALGLDASEYERALKSLGKEHRAINKQTKDLKRSFKEAGDSVGAMGAEIKGTKKHIETHKKAIEKHEAAVNKLKKGVEELNRIEAVGKKLSEADITKRREQISLIEEKEEAIRKEKEALEDRNKELQNYEKAQKAYAEGRDPRGYNNRTEIEKGAGQIALGSTLSSGGQRVSGALSNLYQRSTSVVDQALSFQDDISGALRLAGADQKEEIYELAKEFYASNSLPSDVIGDILEGAVTRNGDDLEAVKLHSQGMIEFIGTSGMNASDAMENLETILNVTGLGVDKIANITSSFNEMENKFGADTARSFGITQNAMKIAGNSGYEVDFVSGLSGFLATLGVEEQGGGTALGKALDRIATSQDENKEVAKAVKYYGSYEKLQQAITQGGKEFTGYVKELGITPGAFKEQAKSYHLLADVARYTGQSVDEVKKMNKEDIFFKLAESINDEAAKSGKNVGEILRNKEYLPAEVREQQVWQSIIGNPERLKEFVKAATEGFSLGESTGDEYEEQQNTTSSRMKRLKNSMNVQLIELGEALLPAVEQVLKAWKPMLATLSGVLKNMSPASIKAWTVALMGLFGTAKTVTGLGNFIKSLGALKVWTASGGIQQTAQAFRDLKDSAKSFNSGFFEVFKGIFKRNKGTVDGGEVLGEVIEEVAENVAHNGDDLAEGVAKVGTQTTSLSHKLGKFAGGLTIFAGIVAGLSYAAKKFEGYVEKKTAGNYKSETTKGLNEIQTGTVEAFSSKNADTVKINSTVSAEGLRTFTGDETAGSVDFIRLNNVDGLLEEATRKGEELKTLTQDAQTRAQEIGTENVKAVETLTQEAETLQQETAQTLQQIQERGGKASAEQADLLKNNNSRLSEIAGALAGGTVKEASQITNASKQGQTVQTKEEFNEFFDNLREQAEENRANWDARAEELEAEHKAGKISEDEYWERGKKISTEKEKYIAQTHEQYGHNYAATHGTGWLSQAKMFKDSWKLSKGLGLRNRWRMAYDSWDNFRENGKKTNKNRQGLRMSVANVDKMKLDGIKPEVIETAKKYNQIVQDIAGNTEKLNRYTTDDKFTHYFDGLAHSPKALENIENLREQLGDMIPPKASKDLDVLTNKLKLYEDLTPEEKDIIIDSNPALAGLRDGTGAIKTWDSLTPEEKDLWLNAKTVEALAQGRIDIDTWNQMTPEEKYLVLQANGQPALDGVDYTINEAQKRANARPITLYQRVRNLSDSLMAKWTGEQRQYGDSNFKGGLAILGDGYRSEKVILPDGREFNTGNRDELWNLPKGTKIHPDARLYDLMKKDVPHFKNGIGDFNFSNTGAKTLGGNSKNNAPVNVSTVINVNGGQFNEKTLSTFVAKEITKEVQRASRAQEASGRGKRRRI